MKNDRLKQHKLFFDLEKELAYINEMNRLGWRLERVDLGWSYSFAKTEPEEYTTLIYAENKSKLEETAALAKRCGYELIPHTADGMKEALYLTGRKSEVSPVFYNDSESVLRAHRMMFKRFFVMSAVSLILLLAMLAELVLFFIIPAVNSGKSPMEIPLFFSLTVGFSALTLLFLGLVFIFAGGTLRVKNKTEKLLKTEEEKKQKKKEAENNPAEAADDSPPEEQQRAVDFTGRRKIEIDIPDSQM